MPGRLSSEMDSHNLQPFVPKLSVDDLLCSVSRVYCASLSVLADSLWALLDVDFVCLNQ